MALQCSRIRCREEAQIPGNAAVAGSQDTKRRRAAEGSAAE